MTTTDRVPTISELKADVEYYQQQLSIAEARYAKARVAESDYEIGDILTNGRFKGEIVRFDFSFALDCVEPIVRLIRGDGTPGTREMHVHGLWRRVGKLAEPGGKETEI